MTFRDFSDLMAQAETQCDFVKQAAWTRYCSHNRDAEALKNDAELQRLIDIMGRLIVEKRAIIDNYGAR